MKSFLYALFFIISSSIFAQTHFTIPQNVWRTSFKSDHSVGKWRGNSISDGLKYKYRVDTTNFEVEQFFNRSISRNLLKLEYGFTDKATLMLEIPIVSNLQEERSWKISYDPLPQKLDSLLNFYYPKPTNNSGLSDITLGLNFLIRGVPAWRGGKQRYSLYTGFDIVFPFAQDLKKFDSKSIDSNGTPLQFKHLPIGEGLTELRVRVFGEFYRKGWGRLLNMNWSFGVSSFQKNIVNPPITFLWMENASADSIAQSIGDVTRKKSPQVNGSIKTQLELVPKRVFVSTGLNSQFNGRDQFFSKNSTISKLMAKRDGFDSQNMLTTQFVKFNFVNLDPFIMLGPLPFELELGASWFLPYPLTYHNFANVASWVQISSYFQSW